HSDGERGRERGDGGGSGRGADYLRGAAAAFCVHAPDDIACLSLSTSSAGTSGVGSVWKILVASRDLISWSNGRCGVRSCTTDVCGGAMKPLDSAMPMRDGQ